MNRHLPARLVLAGIPLFALSLFVACGDDIENTTINQTGVELFDSSDDLPECTDKNESELAFVRGETSARICVDGEWIAMASDGSDVDFSCKTVELKDKSGLKIVCNGDSIGVVLNGSDGKDAVLPQDSLEVDSEQIAISLDSLVGVTQKGPFLKGSTVYLYELSDGRSLKQTNGNFTSNIALDNGRYKFTARDLVSQYAMVVVDGYYRNEVTGKSSEAPIRLKAITDMRKRTSVNVNLLTHLEFDRVYQLVTRGDSETGEKLTVKKAKNQAQKEILDEFHIRLDKSTDAEDMDVFGNSDADAVLLALSILLQGDRSESDLMALLSEISNNMAEDGKWDGARADSIKADMADWALKADFGDSVSKLVKFSGNVSGWGLSSSVPEFEKHIRHFYSIESGLGACGSKDAPKDTVKNVSNHLVKTYYASTYSDVANTKIRFICKENDNHIGWRVANDIEKDTVAWGGDSVGTVRNGQVNANLVYVYDAGSWRHGTDLDSLFVAAGGKACTESNVADTTSERYDGLYYVCTEQPSADIVREWVVTPDLYNTTHDIAGECAAGAYTDARLFTGVVNPENKFVCDNGVFRTADNWEANGGKGCTSYNRDEYRRPERDRNGVKQYSYYKCTQDGWKFTLDSVYTYYFQDGRGYQNKVYWAVGIKTQRWMAENLKYEKDDSYCMGGSAENCEKYGRFYSWASAVGKTEIECGMGSNCGLTGRVQGICPNGYHLPSLAEWDTLFNAIGGIEVAGKVLKTTEGWKNDGNGTDEYRFSAYPTGYYAGFDNYANEGDCAFYWTSTEYNNHSAYYVVLESKYDYAIKSFYSKLNYRSIRCVRDED